LQVIINSFFQLHFISGNSEVDKQLELSISNEKLFRGFLAVIDKS